jgi:hypothetical protein
MVQIMGKRDKYEADYIQTSLIYANWPYALYSVFYNFRLHLSRGVVSLFIFLDEMR